MTSRLPRTDRRRALRATAVVLAVPLLPALAACDAADVTPPRSGSVKQTGRSSQADRTLVASVAARIAGTRDAARRLAKHDAPHRAWLLAVATLHHQHLGRLGATATSPSVVHAASLSTLRTHEEKLQAALVTASGQAESGSLAQVLASMAAAIGQRLAQA